MSDDRTTGAATERESLLAGGEQVRADAARNAARILEAAECLVREHGPDGMTMDAVAERACLGKGTIFRRFQSRAGLMAALMNHTETQFQQAAMAGPPPLGPGAPPRERLLAFGAARLDLVISHGELMRSRGDRGHPAQVPAFDVAVTHVRMLLREAGAGGDEHLLAGNLVNGLDPAWVQILMEHKGYSAERILSGWEDLVVRILNHHGPKV